MDKYFIKIYYPFGMLMPERQWNSGKYRYGFNAMEKDDEVKGSGNSYTAEFWQYDSRLGRRWNLDPVVKPFESPYATYSGNPIWFIDPSGADTTVFLTSFSVNQKGDRESYLGADKLAKIGEVVKNNFERNGINVKIEIVAIGDIDNTISNLASTDAFININPGVENWAGVYGNGYIDYANATVGYNYGKNLAGDHDYITGYITSHEILHQLLVKADLFHFGRRILDGTNDYVGHDNSIPNLNMDAFSLLNHGNGGLPKGNTGSLQRPERILDYQKRMIHYFFKKSHKEYKGGKVR